MLRVVQERVPPLLDALRQFNCEALLTQMRDEIWKMGTVSVEPDENHLTYDTPIGARVALRVEWPVYSPRIIKGDNEYAGTEGYSIPAGIGSREEMLSISAVYGNISDTSSSYSLDLNYDRSCDNILLCVDYNKEGFGFFRFPSAGEEEHKYTLGRWGAIGNGACD
jgi:hypothetical protein